MPAGAPGTLKENEYLDILAYILRENEFPAGARELSAGVIPGIRFEGKDGAAPVPDFSLVQVVGCLSKDPDGAWRLKRATDPLRTRDPNASPEPVLPPGKNTFRILDDSSLKLDSHDGRMAAVKGFLIRKPNDDRLNTTSVEVIAPVCR
jgi:hypothetical protein